MRPSLGQLFRSSGALFNKALPQSAAILAVGLVPGTALALASYALSGIDSQQALDAVIREGAWATVALVLAAGLAKRLLATLAFLALVLSLKARHDKAALTTPQAYALAAKRFVAFLMTVLRALLRVAGGLVLFVVPGLLLALRYSLAHLSFLLEGLRGKAALERSAALVMAQPKRALGFMAAATAAAVALSVGCAVLVAAFHGAAQAASGSAGLNAYQGQIEALAAELLESLVACWLAAFSVELYDDLVAGQ